MDKKSPLIKNLMFYSVLGLLFFAGVFLYNRINPLVYSVKDGEYPFFESVDSQQVSLLQAGIENVPYVIKSRKNLDKGKIHRVQFRVEVPEGINQKQLRAIGQKIVRETLNREYCHSISVDFGWAGYMDFAPFGNWAKAGEVPIDSYKNYRFKYFFPSTE